VDAVLLGPIASFAVRAPPSRQTLEGKANSKVQNLTPCELRSDGFFLRIAQHIAASPDGFDVMLA